MTGIKLTAKSFYLIFLLAFAETGFSQDAGYSFSDHDGRWSPDGSQVVFYSNRSGNFDIYKVNADGSGLTQLTNNSAYDGMPDWSPDGQTITFASDRDGDFDIYKMNTDGSDVQNLTQTDTFEGTHRWSPDGQKIAFEGRLNDKNNEIFTMNSDGTNRKKVTNNQANDFSPDWSPDGKTLFFQSSRNGKYQVYSIEINEKKVTPLTKGNNHNLMGSVSPDGSKLAILGYREKIPQVFLVSMMEKDQLEKITNTPVGKQRAEFSADGSKILYNRIQSKKGKIQGDMFIINTDGTGNMNLTKAIE